MKHLPNIFITLLCFFLLGCSDLSEKENLDDQLILVLNYQRSTGKLPESWDDDVATFNFENTSKPLKTRGTTLGRSLVYMKISESAFLLLSSGSNNVFESGNGDDSLVLYLNGEIVMKQVLIKYLETTNSYLLKQLYSANFL